MHSLKKNNKGSIFAAQFAFKPIIVVSLVIAFLIPRFSFAKELCRPKSTSARPIVGATITERMIASNANLRKFLCSRFNSFTPGLELKLESLRPSSWTLRPEPAEGMIEFAKGCGAKVHAHALVWENAIPEWAKLALTNKTNLEKSQFLERHIRETVKYFSKKYQRTISGWDVVNEMVNERGALRETFWVQGTQEDVYQLIKNAFTWAHEADPRVPLYYNDYSIEGLGPKAEGVYKLVKRLKSDGVPIHGVGIQGHFLKRTLQNLPKSQKEVLNNFSRIGKLGLKIELTEIDMAFSIEPFAEPSNGSLNQALQNTINACLESEACDLINFWTIHPQFSWINKFGKSLKQVLLLDAEGKETSFLTDFSQMMAAHGSKWPPRSCLP